MENITDIDRTLAREWYKVHKNHIDHLINDDYVEFSYSPSHEDANKPYLWKPEHWKWFLEKEI